MAQQFDDGGVDFDDPYRKRVTQQFDDGGVDFPNGGIAGPQDGGFPEAAPAAAPATPKGGYDLEGLRSAWTQQGIGAKTSPEALKAFLASRPDIATGVTTSASGDALFDPQGRFIADAIADVGGRNTVGFLDNIDSRGKARVPAKGKGKAGVPAAPGAGVAMTPAAAAPPAANGFLTQIRQMIMDRMGALQQPVDPNDPAIKAQMDAARLQGTRNQEQIRKALAERMVAQGGTGVQGGELNQAVQQSLERQGADLMGLQGDLLSQRDLQNRDQVQQLMNMALQSGDSEAARELQMQLARIDESLRLKQLAENSRQFGLDLGYRNRALAQSGSQFDRNLDFQRGQWGDQFGRSLGRDYEDDYRWRAMFGLGG